MATVRGTASFFSSELYTDRCGSEPAPRPIFPSRARQNGLVGFDPEFLFAEPRFVRQCAEPNPPFTIENFQVNTRFGYRHPMLLGPALTAPRASHRYGYALVGRGARPKFRAADRITKDNYGRFRIASRRARPADCSNGEHLKFRFLTETECVAATRRRRG